MAFTKKPSQPPTLDSKAFVARLRDMVAKLGVGPYSVFGDDGLPKFHRWIRGELEYDAIGLRDVVNANAYAVDNLKDDVDKLPPRVHDLEERVAVLESQPSAPFPA